MSEARREIIFIPYLLPSMNNMFGVIKNPKLHPKTKLGMIKGIMGEQAQYANKIEKYIENLEIEPFDSDKMIKLSYVPFYGEETEKTFNIKTRKSRKNQNRNPLDCVNYSVTMKSIEDRLVALRILKEDNYKVIPTNEILPAIVDRSYEGHGIFVIIDELDEVEYFFTDEMKSKLKKIKKNKKGK